MFSERGQTLLELVVVMSVSVIIIGALVFATIASLRNAQFSKNQSLAAKLAQEGIERVRVGRDRNTSITNLSASVTSWNGNSSTLCSGSTVIKADSLWCYHISGNCDSPDLIPAGFCYFNVDSSGGLNSNGFGVNPIPSQAEVPTGNAAFRRYILLSDDLNHDKNFTTDDWLTQKEVTVVVTWTDFSGSHESRLTTILRRI